MVKDWPECPYCGEPLESEMIYTDLGPRGVMFCTCETYTEIQEQLVQDIKDSLKEDD